MDIEKEREAFLKWHYQAYLLENPEIDMQNAQYIYDYAHKNALSAQLRESHFTVWQAAKAQAVLEVKPSRCVTLTCAQLREAFMFGAPDKDDQEQLETEMTISWSENGHSGKGYYCYYSDLPEEGAIFLDDVIEAREQAND